jgi:HEAT repeat protein
MKKLQLVLCIGLCVVSNVTAQVRDSARRPPAAAATPDAATLASGWSAVAGGQFDAATGQADTILQRRPWDLAALTLKINALSAASSIKGLAAYEQWQVKSKREDVALLEPVAIAVVQEIARGSNPEQHALALAELAAAHVAGAAEPPAGPGSTQQAQLAANVDAARRGDSAAIGRLNAQANDRASATVALVTALQQIGSSGESGLLMLVNAANPAVRAAAVRALGASKSERALPVLHSLFDGMDPATRVPATVALAQLGDAPALARIDQMLASNVPQVQIAAAEAWSGRPGPWTEIIRALLDNPDGFTRLDAAKAIAPVDPEAAKRTLNAALDDPNPVIRYQSATSIEDLSEGNPAVLDVASLRKRLRDADPMVRLAVASTLLKLARS